MIDEVDVTCFYCRRCGTQDIIIAGTTIENQIACRACGFAMDNKGTKTVKR